MVQGYMRQDNGGKGGWYSFPRLRKAAEEKCQAGSDWDVSSRLYGTHTCGDTYDQQNPYLPEESELSSGTEKTDRETGWSILSVTGINRFYYLHGLTDMRCKCSHVLFIIQVYFFSWSILYL